MKNGKHGVIAQIAGPALVLAALLALVLSNPGIGRAQAGTASSAVTLAKPAKAAPVVQAGQMVTPSERRPGGTHEGITVHGHWTIEVKNPDGKVVTHREFENGLSNDNNGGATFISAVLGGAVTPGSWQVALSDNTGNNVMFFNPPNSATAANCPNQVSPLPGSGSCSNSLTVTSAQFQADALTGAGTLTFAGSGTVPQGFPATIGAVSTGNLSCTPSTLISACFNAPRSSWAVYGFFTSRTLDGQGSDPVPVPVAPGQTVAVTVVISFGSGS
jgi:hypothetical protein